MPHILLVPSGTGKTWSTIHAIAPNLVDGDAVIDHYIGWPDGRWWETAKERVHRENWACLEAHALHAPNAIILFNGHPYPQNPFVKLAAVLPDLDLLMQNARRRGALSEIRARRRTRPTAQPQTADELVRSWNNVAAFARDLALHTFPSIIAAATARVDNKW